MNDEAPGEVTVLLIDPDAARTERIRRYLSEADYSVVCARNTDEAAEKMRRSPATLILASLPEDAGKAAFLCGEIRSHEEARETPILAIVTPGLLGEITEAHKLPADEFLIRPVNARELQLRVKSLLRLTHLKTQLARTGALVQRAENGAADRDT